MLHLPLHSLRCQLHKHICSHCTFLDVMSQFLLGTNGCKWRYQLGLRGGLKEPSLTHPHISDLSFSV